MIFLVQFENLTRVLFLFYFVPHGLSYCRNTKPKTANEICLNSCQIAIFAWGPCNLEEKIFWPNTLTIIIYIPNQTLVPSLSEIVSDKAYKQQTRGLVDLFSILSIPVLYSSFSIPLILSFLFLIFILLLCILSSSVTFIVLQANTAQ